MPGGQVSVGNIVHASLVLAFVANLVGETPVVLHGHQPAGGDQFVAGDAAHLGIRCIDFEIVKGNAVQFQRHLCFSSFLSPHQPR